jgi:hypothetical protein
VCALGTPGTPPSCTFPPSRFFCHADVGKTKCTYIAGTIATSYGQIEIENKSGQIKMKIVEADRFACGYVGQTVSCSSTVDGGTFVPQVFSDAAVACSMSREGAGVLECVRDAGNTLGCTSGVTEVACNTSLGLEKFKVKDGMFFEVAYNPSKVECGRDPAGRVACRRIV